MIAKNSMRRFFNATVLALLLALVIGIASWTWLRANSAATAASTANTEQSDTFLETLNNWGPVPEFSLIERSGQSIQRSDLQGKVWVAAFFLMVRLQRYLPIAPRLMTEPARPRVREAAAG